MSGSGGRLFSNTEEILKAMAVDVDAAERRVLMEFYIWNEGDLADDVLDAVLWSLPWRSP